MGRFGDVSPEARMFYARATPRARAKPPYEHFTVEGKLIRSWASPESISIWNDRAKAAFRQPVPGWKMARLVGLVWQGRDI